MRMLIHTPILVGTLILLGSQSVAAAALDKAVRDVLKEEAAETSLREGRFIADLAPDPSPFPDKNADLQALEDRITSQIKQALSSNSSTDKTSDSEQQKLGLALESVVFSALMQGNKLDDIRNAVAVAMTDLQGAAAVENEIPVEKLQSAAVALRDIVSAGIGVNDGEAQSNYIESLKAELTAEISVKPNTQTMSAVDKILAAMPKTQQITEKVAKPQVNKPQVKSPPEKKIRRASKPAVVQNTAETVTVLKGESLFKIAKRVYGSGRKYLRLYEANKDTIANPNVIIVGQILKVPR